MRCGKMGHSREQCTARKYECKDVCTNRGAIGIHKTEKCTHPALPPTTLVREGTRKPWRIPPQVDEGAGGRRPPDNCAVRSG